MHIAEGELLSSVEVINPPQLRLLIGRRRSSRRCILVGAVDRNEILVEEAYYFAV